MLLYSLDIFRRKFAYFEKNIGLMDELFESTFSPLAATGKPLSRCGKCNRYMKLIMTKPSRMHCPHCDDTYNLPQNGKIMLYKEIKCPLDGFELVLFSTGGRGLAYPVCPNCYTNPPFEGMARGRSGCNSCVHPTCGHSLENLGVCTCIECDDGMLVLDESSAPKWRMACNVCNVVVGLFEDAFKVATTDDVCEVS